MDDRFLRIERLLGIEAVQRLHDSMVTVVGLGAVGGYVVEGLARAGVGHLRLVDFDWVRRHNINRQIIALESTVGMKKTDCLADRVAGINPNCRIEIFDLFADRDTIPHILHPMPDLLVDAIDSMNPKIELLAMASEQNIPVISSMGAALRTDPSRVKISDIFKTRKCPLAKRLRKKLRQRGVQAKIPCVYSDEDIDFQYRDAELEKPDQGPVPEFERGRPRLVLGSLPTITGIFGLTLANMAIGMLSGVEKK